MSNNADLVILLIDGSYLIRGHVSREEAEAIIQQNDDPDFRLDQYCFVEQCYVRAIPMPKDQRTDYDYRYEHSAPGRGAFACTAVWI